MSMTVDSLKTYAVNTWCPGCGNFGIERGIKQVFADLVNEGSVKKENIVILSGIGCHAKMVDYIAVNSFYSLHGRVVAPATGIKVANPELTVVGFAGDGDAYGEGLEHLIFAAKRNVNITMMIHNNRVYGLTTGQYTPTSPKGFAGRSTPKGSLEEPMNPIELMLASGASFVARAFPLQLEPMKSVMKQAILHRGFALVDILQPCFTFYNTYQFYRPRVFDLQQAGHDPSDWEAAMQRAREWNYTDADDSKIALGVFYRAEKPAFDESLLGERRLLALSSPALDGVLETHI